MCKALDLIRQLFLYAGCKNEEEYESILPEIRKSNRESLKIISFTMTIFILLMVVSHRLLTFYDGFTMNYLFVFLFVLVLTFIIWHSPNDNLIWIQPVVYLFIGLIYFFGTLNALIVTDQPAVSIIALLLCVPVLFIDKPIRILFSSLIAMACFSLSAIIAKPGEIVEYDVINTMIYGLTGVIISTQITSIKISKFLMEKKLRLMGEIDFLTGLKNRNSYEESLKLYPERFSTCLTCIYLDINGLHELNNAKGHKAGDQMLCTVAEELKRYFSIGDIFRIGGDEFVVFLVDQPDFPAEEVLRTVTEILEEQDYHISWGCQTKKDIGTSVTELITSTEMMMYRAKAEYYQKKGTDRRRSR